MDVFDIIGPIMVGPSSSHTAGAVRLGRVARRLVGGDPASVVIYLHGSFAHTYKGHGTDKAIIAGLLGMLPDDEGIRESKETAKKKGIEFSFETIALKDAHPNTAVITATDKKGKTVTIQGSSVGGGNIVINKIDGLEVEFTGEYYTLVISQSDAPGIVAAVANLLATNNINIATMKLYRSHREGQAIMVLETDQEVKSELTILIEQIRGIKRATLIEPV